MTDPIVAAVAGALTTKMIDGLSEAGRHAFAALTRLVCRKLGIGEQPGAALAPAGTEPEDEHALAEAIRIAAANDRLFAEELARLWHEVQRSHAASGDGWVFNNVSGDVAGAVVQARDVQGGISFGTH